MPGGQNRKFYEGAKAEHLAQFLLSHLAFVTPVPRQVDCGADLVCTLTRREGEYLYPGSSFLVQVKSTRNRKKPPLPYGGLKRGKSKQYETRWLFSQPLPFLLVFADTANLSIEIYSTVRMWWVRWMVCDAPFKVTLAPEVDPTNPDDKPYDRYPHVGETTPAEQVAKAEWTVPLGAPIAKISAGEIGNSGFVDSVRECLDAWLRLDNLNVLCSQQRVPVSIEYECWQLNRVPERRHLHPFPYRNPTPGLNIREIAWALQAPLVAMRDNADAQNNNTLLNLVDPLLKECQSILAPAAQKVSSTSG